MLSVLFGCEAGSDGRRADDSEGDSEHVASGASGGTGVGGGIGGEQQEEGHTHDGGTSSSSGGEHGLGGSLAGSGGTGDSGGGDGSGGTRESDGTGGSGAVIINGCIDYLDRSLPGDDRNIAWSLGVEEDPERCLAISVGQSVTWNGNLAHHPLRNRRGDTPNPIESTSAGETVEFSFPDVGTFGFICVKHSEMRGAIRVLP